MEESRMEWSKEKASSMAEKTFDGMYKCKICGQVFPTLEAHGEHHRKMHEQTAEMPSENQTVEREPM